MCVTLRDYLWAINLLEVVEVGSERLTADLDDCFLCDADFAAVLFVHRDDVAYVRVRLD